MIFDGTYRATLRPGMVFMFAAPKSEVWRVVYANAEVNGGPGGYGIMSPAFWADLPAGARAVVDVLHECGTEAEARDLYQSRYAAPAPGPWQVKECEPQHTDLAIISREPEPEVFETVDHRLLAGLHRAVVAAEDRARAAVLRAQMAEAQAQAAWRGQVPVVAWAFVLGAVLGAVAVAVVSG